MSKENNVYDVLNGGTIIDSSDSSHISATLIINHVA